MDYHISSDLHALETAFRRENKTAKRLNSLLRVQIVVLFAVTAWILFWSTLRCTNTAPGSGAAPIRPPPPAACTIGSYSPIVRERLHTRLSQLAEHLQGDDHGTQLATDIQSEVARLEALHIHLMCMCRDISRTSLALSLDMLALSGSEPDPEARGD